MDRDARTGAWVELVTHETQYFADPFPRPLRARPSPSRSLAATC